MVLRLFMRGGIYVLFIAGVVISWLMKRASQNESREELTAVKKRVSELRPEDAVTLLHDANWQMRLAAVQALRDDPTAAALPGLLDALADDDPDVRQTAAEALEARKTAAIPGLLQLLQGGRANSREMAIQILANIGGTEAMQGIADALLHDESAWVRIPAAQALGATKDRAFIEVLTAALQDKHAAVYDAAAQALQAIQTPAALQALARNPYRPGDDAR